MLVTMQIQYHVHPSEFCTSSCLSNRIMGIYHEFVDTPPNELKFNDPANFIDNSRAQCNSYFIKNVMLGKPILMSVCVLDYYNQYVDSVQSETNLNYHISEPKQVIIFCDTLEKLSIIGNQSQKILQSLYHIKYCSVF